MGGDALGALAIALSGIGLGILSAMLPLGPVTVLVLRRVVSGDPSGALRVGLGRVPAEVIYCALATFGTVALLDRFPEVRTGVAVSGTLLLLGVGAWLLVDTARPQGPAAVEVRAARRWGDLAGLILSILNPSYLLSYSAIVAFGVSVTGRDPTLPDRVVFPLAIGCGVALGYLALVTLLRRYDPRAERVWVRRAIRATGGVFVGIAVCNAVALVGGL